MPLAHFSGFNASPPGETVRPGPVRLRQGLMRAEAARLASLSPGSWGPCVREILKQMFRKPLVVVAAERGVQKQVRFSRHHQ